MAQAAALRELPRLVLETLAFGGILALVLYLMATQGNVAAILPIVGLYAFAGYRLLPAFKALFKSLAILRFHTATVQVIDREVTENRAGLKEKHPLTEFRTPLLFSQAVELREVTFSYPTSKRPALQHVSVVIPHRHSVAFVGPTGAGKTTLVDILLGLFTPQSGCLMVDGIPIRGENLLGWRHILGYVPQQIYLCDDTVTRNIAFGIPDEQIDPAAVEGAARIANVHDFIVKDLPRGYETLIGERGVRLSGGQRQRIGIARALYHDPDVLIFDEATSSLDGITENVVLEAINNMARTKTLIMIAHRLSTVESCDVIYLLDLGHVVGRGTYDELVASNEKFRAMAHWGSSRFGSLEKQSLD
jgi:ABC-type multidrug transport system fused ATPase/permease subunit